MSDYGYGLWFLVVFNSLLFILFAVSFFHPKTSRDRRALGGFSAFVVALFTEMYGYPLTVLCGRRAPCAAPGASRRSAAPCSVLVARKGSEAFPRKIVVGIDGSPEAAAAYVVAKQLAERFETELVPAVAHGGETVDRLLVDQLVGHYREDLPDEPVRALVAASADADLLVVGSRGLHGLKALGSVSERVAHQARSSVLIVREPPWQRASEELPG